MPTTTLTSKGQLTIPKSVRDRLRLKEGDRVEVEIDGDRIVLTPARGGISDLASMLPRPAKPVSFDTMRRIVRAKSVERAR